MTGLVPTQTVSEGLAWELGAGELGLRSAVPGIDEQTLSHWWVGG
jgi:hypothetical protein